MSSSDPLNLISAVPELETFSLLSPSSRLYLDLEGHCLSQHGTISPITIVVHPQKVVRIIDILLWEKPAFTTASNNGKTRKSILENPDITKCAWDIWNDAPALWALYHISLLATLEMGVSRLD